ncbi:MAG: sulfurtransferase [Defluviimonas sp.]|uniref:rhodanese-like domain-containing protein n=1 Tax=Albidovulum sp. TaxID=1872424 RepID=UPI001DEFAD74|nr:sulfurtransferase [Paracoccaceae bacterium]MCC0064223.1 sulfurtransferase [Defluviimonas sp.]
MRLFGSSPAPRMPASDIVARVGTGEIVLIDVREAGELAAFGRAEGALHVPLAVLRMKCDPSCPECLAELKSGRPIALYCASGARSQMAAQVLKSLGHGEVVNLGGLGDWIAAGGAVSR